MPVISLEISGNDKQEEREGYNKIKIIRTNITSAGVTFTNNNDGSFTLNGTNNASGALYFNFNIDGDNTEYFTLTKNKKYYMYLKGLKTGTRLMARSRNEQNFSLILSDEISKITEWTKETATDGIAYIEVSPGTTFNNETFYPMLAESETELPYEPYGAMPSPEFPSEVETVNTQANIVVSNKNILNFDEFEIYTNKNGVTLEKEGNSIILNGKWDASYQQVIKGNGRVDITDKLKDGATYTLSQNIYTSNAYAQVYSRNKETGAHVNRYFTSSTAKTFTVNKALYDYIFQIQNGLLENMTQMDNLKITIQLEEGDTATEIIEHSEQTKVVDIQKPMLSGDYFVKEADGWKEVHIWGEYTFTGNENFNFGNAYQDKYRRFSMAYDASLNVKKAYWEEMGAKSNYFKGIANKNYSTAKNNAWINEQSKLNLAINITYLTEDSVNGLNTYLAQKYAEGNPVYVWYKLETPTKLACTEAQSKQLDDLLNTSTYKNVTHIYSTDKVSPVIKIKYRKDIETMLNNQQSEYETRLSNIEKLLSTTTTSALLLDNLQTDLEKEVL